MKQLLTAIAAVLLVGCGAIKPIYDAALEGNIEVVKQHLATGTDVETFNRHGETPLYLAAAEGHKEIVELLIAAGADVNVKIGDNKMTPLPMAARDGSIEIVELLIANGADVNAKQKGVFEGYTPLHNAVTVGDSFMNFSQKEEVIELLIANGADVNAMSSRFGTPLDSAFDVRYPKTAALLRKHGGKTGEELKAEGK